MPLHIPNTAPFSGAQKMWLTGYLDALNSALSPASGGATTPVAAAPVAAGLPVTILWGSQTGNSQALGKKLSKTLAAKGHSPILRDMAEVSAADLAKLENLLIITSTYGDGEPPDNAAGLYAALHAPDAPPLVSVNFAVLALGDSNYPDFCKCGHDFHQCLAALGAKPLLPIVESDVDYDEPFANWISLLEKRPDRRVGISNFKSPTVPKTLQRLPALKKASTQDIEQGNLIDQLLAEQKQLQTPVARFSDVHHQRKPDLADHYRSLIPLTKPGVGEQYAFEVSLDRCTGCKACVSACHSLNGLDDHEVWRDTGTLLGGRDAPGWQQTITTACHHCEDPGCMNGCPVGAYEKDRDTGIVRHLDDQCIGCSYCILKCPYDVPKYSKKRGIVRKCDMCHQRLAEGEAPACVQACPTEAIRIVKTPTRHSQPSSLLGDWSITRPTTRYVGREVLATAAAADQTALIPQHAHWPLVFMLVLTQAGIGLLITARGSLSITLTGAALFFSGMAASVLHLGQPLKAWRFFLGLRSSWLSREILAFSLFAPIPVALSVFAVLPFIPEFPIPSFIADLLPLASCITAGSVVPLGLVAVFTSVMIYHDTHRSLWRFPLGAMRFFGTFASFAALGNLIVGSGEPAVSASLFLAAVLLKLAAEVRFLQPGAGEDIPWSPDVQSARLQLGPLGIILRCRITFAMLAVAAAFIQPWAAVPLLLLAELLERQLFFQCVHAPKMPGNFGPKSYGHP